jgi:hypothetical protein
VNFLGEVPTHLFSVFSTTNCVFGYWKRALLALSFKKEKICPSRQSLREKTPAKFPAARYTLSEEAAEI